MLMIGQARPVGRVLFYKYGDSLKLPIYLGYLILIFIIHCPVLCPDMLVLAIAQGLLMIRWLR